MKKIILVISTLLIAISTNTYALIFSHGPYFGGQIGWGRINEGDGYKHLANSENNKSVELGAFTAWRLYAGYPLIPFFSIEGGYSHFPENKYTAENISITNDTYGIDAVGKITIPLGLFFKGTLSYFSIYGKGGFIYLNTNIKGHINKKENNGEPNGKTNFINVSTGSIRPTYGAGLIYNLTENITFDLSWTGGVGKTRVNSKDNVENGTPVPNFNMYTLGVTYKITRIL